MMVILVIDYTEKNESYIKHNLAFDEIFNDYILNFIPYMANMLSPITIFISAVFVAAKMAAHTETVAIISSGVSFRRLLVPYIIGSGFIGLIVFALTAWVIPEANKVRNAFENAYVRGTYYFDGRNVHFKISPNTYVYLESYNNTIHVGYKFSIEQIENKKLVKKVKADRLVWQSDKESWQLDRYTIRTISDSTETLVKGRVMDTTINLSPEDFETKHMLQEQLSIEELDDYIEELKIRGAENVEVYLIEKYERYAYPFAIIILTLIGVVVAAQKRRGGVGLQIALGFFLAFVYILFVILSRSIGKVGSIPPLVAAWLPNILFGTIGYILYLKNRQ